jgi:hypothetical protein
LGRSRRRPGLAERVGGRAGSEASSNQRSAWGGGRAGAKVAWVSPPAWGLIVLLRMSETLQRKMN